MQEPDGKTPHPPLAVGRAHAVRNLVAILRDIVYVTFGKYGQYIVTLATLPFTSRVLGIDGLGHLAIGMAAYFIGSVLVDLGITSFLAAKVSDSDVNQLRADYLTVRVSILAILGATLLLTMLLDTPYNLHMVALGLFVGGFFSVSEDWLLIGNGRFGASIAYQAAGRMLYLALLFLLLPVYPTASTALACLFLSAILTISLTWGDAFRRYGRPSKPRNVIAILRIGAPVVTSRLLTTVYSQGAPAVYAGVLSAASLGLYSASDRLVRGVQSLLDPIGYALLPRMARKTNPKDFWRSAGIALLACLAAACTAGALVWVTSPFLISLIFGNEFSGAVSLIRIEIFIIPATALTSLVTTAVLPVRQDTFGILVGAVIGTTIAACALFVAYHSRSVWVLVYGTLASEYSVAIWYAFRAGQLLFRDRAASRATTDVEIVVAETVPGGGGKA